MLIKADPRPVFMLDTCTLLDIVRAPLHNKAAEIEVAVKHLVRSPRRPSAIHLVIVFPTLTEWRKNIAHAVTDCQDAINAANAVSEAWGYLGIEGIPPLPEPAMILPDHLKEISERLMEGAICLDKNHNSMKRAVDRLIHAQRPVKKGGGGATDAIIMEHALGLTSELRRGGFERECFFVSSNTREFAAENTTRLHPVLVPAFAAPTNLHYAASLTAAINQLRSTGWTP